MRASAPGPAVEIRGIRDLDAESLLELQRRLDVESSMMLLEPGERNTSPDMARAQLRRTLASPNSTILVAAHDEEVVGYIEAQGGRYRRNRHSAYVVIGVMRAWQGQGIGRALLFALDEWARAHGVWRLELTVRADNERARRLYERAGYIPEGTRRGSLLIEGEPADEVNMARVLDPGTTF